MHRDIIESGCFKFYADMLSLFELYKFCRLNKCRRMGRCAGARMENGLVATRPPCMLQYPDEIREFVFEPIRPMLDAAANGTLRRDQFDQATGEWKP